MPNRRFPAVALGLCLAAASLSSTARAANAAAGRVTFQRQCAICHSAEAGDGGGAQGPSLAGIIGRPAAAVSGFGYTQALRGAGLTWDAATLARFLASPSTLVPGTAMGVAVSDPLERANLIAYFRSPAVAGATALAAPPSVPEASRRSADWRLDRPGRRHRIDVAALPPPLATPSAANGPQIIPRPPGAKLAVPAGFGIAPFAEGLLGPRKMLLAANGDVFVTETDGGRITVLRPNAAGTTAQAQVYAAGLRQPFGIAFYPNAAHPQWLYVAESARVLRYAFASGDRQPRGAPEVVVADLPTGGHYTRDIAFSADGRRLFLSIGSASNVAESMPQKTPAEIAAWEAGHGRGAAWDEEAGRADVLVYEVADPRRSATYATGLRNCVSLTPQPATGALWCTVNERDRLGDDLVPDYSTRVREGGFYGWPWYYFGNHQDPRLAGRRPDLAGAAIVPDIAYQSHSAPLGLTFYVAADGPAAFPARFAGDAFVTFHGSWNRSLRTGYKLVRVPMRHGLPAGGYEDFVTGFIVDDGNVWGRPVATLELGDGSLLMSDDAGNLIWRIAHAPKAPQGRGAR